MSLPVVQHAISPSALSSRPRTLVRAEGPAFVSPLKGLRFVGTLTQGLRPGLRFFVPQGGTRSLAARDSRFRGHRSSDGELSQLSNQQLALSAQPAISFSILSRVDLPSRSRRPVRQPWLARAPFSAAAVRLHRCRSRRTKLSAARRRAPLASALPARTPDRPAPSPAGIADFPSVRLPAECRAVSCPTPCTPRMCREGPERRRSGRPRDCRGSPTRRAPASAARRTSTARRARESRSLLPDG